MSLDKKSILLSFDEEDLLDFRKILFKKGLSVQEFFAHIMHRCVMRDESMEIYYEQILEKKKELVEKGGKLKNYKLDDVDSMYDAIEQHLKKRE